LDAVCSAAGTLWTDALRLVHGPALDPHEITGKLLRPALCLLSAGAAGARDLGRFVELAASFEVLHLAALTHDDVIDRAKLRRGVTSLNALWDDRSAVLGGDFLVARAIALITAYGSCELIADVVESVRQMAEGELCSLGRDSNTLTQDDCLRLARQKTASLFASTCAGPTFLLDTPHRDPLRDYGLGFGIAFQLADDMLDLSRTEAELGKPSCGDIVEGKITLPILFMREALDATDLARLDALTEAGLDDADRQWVAAAHERTGARAQTEAVARRYVAQARTAADALPPSPCQESMTQLLEFVLVRGS